MKSLASYDRTKVGLVGITLVMFVAVLVGAASLFQIGHTSYQAMMDHTGGLRVGEEVQVAGVGVGEVTGIDLEADGVRVWFTVADHVRLGDRTRTEVKVATLLGTHYLSVEPRGAGTLPDNTIPMARTRTPYNLQDVLDDGVPELREFDPAVLERSFREIATTLDASGDELGPALDGVRELSGHIATRSDDLAALLGATRNVSRQLSASGGDIIELMRQADLILDTLRVRRAAIGALLRDLTSFGTELAGTVDDISADTGPLLADLEHVVGVLAEHDESLDAALTVIAPAARYFANAAGTGRWLDQYVETGLPDGIYCLEKRKCA